MAQRGQAYRRYQRQILQPVAGAELDITPDMQGGWRIQALIFTLTTSAVAGTRIVQLSATDGTTEWWRSPAVAEITPSSASVFVSHPGVVGGGAAGAEVAKQTSGVFAAAGTLAQALSNGDSITGFALNMQGIAAGVQTDVTVTNILGGTMTFRITSPVAGATLVFTFPDPIPALNSGVAPTVTYTGQAGSPAGSIVVFGRASTSDNVSSMAMPDEGIVLQQGWHLRTVTAARDAGDQYSAVMVVVEELASGPDWNAQAQSTVNLTPLDS